MADRRDTGRRGADDRGRKDDDENYDPRADPDHEDYDPDYDPAAEPDGGAAPADSDPQDDPRLAQMVKKAVEDAVAPIAARNRELVNKVREMQKSIGQTPPDDYSDDPQHVEYTETVLTNETLFKGIGSEFGLALAPLIARLEALEEGNDNIVKAVEEHGVILEGVSDKQDAIQKAIGTGSETEAIVKALVEKQETAAKTTPAEGATAPSGAVTADDVLIKGVDGDALTGEEREQAVALMEKANVILREYDIMAGGYEDAVGAMNEGGFTRSTLSALRKGVDVAETESQRLVKA